MAKIAWIEDDSEEISSLVRLLELDNFEVARYRTRNEVEEKIGDILISEAIILDMILPPVTEDEPYQGISILKLLRQRYHYANPVVVCSVVRASGIIATLNNLNVSAILHKPLRPSVLYEEVKKLVQKDSREEGKQNGSI